MEDATPDPLRAGFERAELAQAEARARVQRESEWHATKRRFLEVMSAAGNPGVEELTIVSFTQVPSRRKRKPPTYSRSERAVLGWLMWEDTTIREHNYDLSRHTECYCLTTEGEIYTGTVPHNLTHRHDYINWRVPDALGAILFAQNLEP